MNLAELIPLESPDSYNSGLVSPDNAFMINLLGKPGPLGEDCQDAFPFYTKRLVTASVGPFRVTGLKVAVLSLRHVFEHVAAAGRHDLIAGVKTAGMFCCRAVRGTNGTYSNHSWGCAIDLYFGADVVPYGDPHTQRGIADLYPFAHAAGWYSGQGYHNRRDSMHVEASCSLLQQWQRLGLLD